MSAPRRRLPAAATVLIALLGAWMVHTLEFVRVAGGAQLGAPFSGVHIYMLPIGVVLGICAAVGAARIHRIALRVGATVAALRDELAGRQAAATVVRGADGLRGGDRLVALAVLLTVGQTAIYLIQENVESAAFGRGLPGIGVLAGVHAAVLPLQIVVALFLATAVALATWPLRRQLRTADRLRSLVRALRTRRGSRREVRIDAVPRVLCGTGLGASIWCRPPPSIS